MFFVLCEALHFISSCLVNQTFRYMAIGSTDCYEFLFFLEIR